MHSSNYGLCARNLRILNLQNMSGSFVSLLHARGILPAAPGLTSARAHTAVCHTEGICGACLSTACVCIHVNRAHERVHTQSSRNGRRKADIGRKWHAHVHTLRAITCTRTSTRRNTHMWRRNMQCEPPAVLVRRSETGAQKNPLRVRKQEVERTLTTALGLLVPIQTLIASCHCPLRMKRRGRATREAQPDTQRGHRQEGCRHLMEALGGGP